jgi:hypothetical protein
VPSAFEAPTLRAFVAAAFDGDDLSDPVTAEPEAEPATCGRVSVDGDDLPDELVKSPDGERTWSCARVPTDGTFERSRRPRHRTLRRRRVAPVDRFVVRV